MQDKKKSGWFKEQIRQFIMGFQLISSLALGLFLVIVLYFAMNYVIDPVYSEEQIAEAQKVGNWKFPDNNYILKNFENITVGNRTIGVVTVKDKVSKNLVLISEINLGKDEALEETDVLKKQIMQYYGLENYYPRPGNGKMGPIGDELVYNMAGWKSLGDAKIGVVGSLDCIKKRKTGSVILAIAYNGADRFDLTRALALFSKLNCPIVADNGDEEDPGKGYPVDTDGDGLPDKIEKMIGSDPYKKDTDNDGFNDFDEVKNGYNPMIPRPWDKYTNEEFQKVKQDIKFISIDIYDKLFVKN